MIHHVQVTCPPGSEAALRAFYIGVLGLGEKPKPPALTARGGCWFHGYGIELHLSVEDDFRPARKAHPGLLWPDLDALAARLAPATEPLRQDRAISRELVASLLDGGHYFPELVRCSAR